MTIKDISLQILVGIFVGFLIQAIKNLSLQGKIPVNFYKEKWGIGFIVILLAGFLGAILKVENLQLLVTGTFFILYYSFKQDGSLKLPEEKSSLLNQFNKLNSNGKKLVMIFLGFIALCILSCFVYLMGLGRIFSH